jgi:hypothetical protein
MTVISKNLLFLILAFPFTLFSQENKVKWDTSANRVRNVIFTIPVSRNTTINGLAIGLMPTTLKNAKNLKINGLSIHASPLDIVFGVYSLAFSVKSLTRNRKDTAGANETVPLAHKDVYPKKDTTRQIIQNGLLIGGTNGGNKINGINISVIGNSTSQMNGLSISGLFNVHYNFNGILIGALRNKTTTGKGVQIALFNSCQSGKLIQFGLINRIGKRVVPVVNFSL